MTALDAVLGTKLSVATIMFAQWQLLPFLSSPQVR